MKQPYKRIALPVSTLLALLALAGASAADAVCFTGATACARLYSVLRENLERSPAAGGGEARSCEEAFGTLLMGARRSPLAGSDLPAIVARARVEVAEGMAGS